MSWFYCINRRYETSSYQFYQSAYYFIQWHLDEIPEFEIKKSILPIPQSRTNPSPSLPFPLPLFLAPNERSDTAKSGLTSRSKYIFLGWGGKKGGGRGKLNIKSLLFFFLLTYFLLLLLLLTVSCLLFLLITVLVIIYLIII